MRRRGGRTILQGITSALVLLVTARALPAAPPEPASRSPLVEPEPPTVGVAAAPDSPRVAAAPGPHVWYRSGPGCPDGEQFVQRLQRLGRTASLARVGDPVDFVVTVASTPGRSSGRLERQSERGTVAIRELSATSCGEVAEGLALSLELAAEPEVRTDAGLTEHAPLGGAESGAIAAGVQLGGESGAGGVLPAGALFVELGGGVASARLSLRAAHGSIQRDVLVSLGLARVEGCVRAWRSAFSASQLSLRPCVGADLGVVQGDSSADDGQRQRAAWAAAVGHVRGMLQLGAGVALEAQAGAVVPLTRYEFRTVRGLELARTPPAGAQAALGASLSW